MQTVFRPVSLRSISVDAIGQRIIQQLCKLWISRNCVCYYVHKIFGAASRYSQLHWWLPWRSYGLFDDGRCAHWCTTDRSDVPVGYMQVTCATGCIWQPLAPWRKCLARPCLHGNIVCMSSCMSSCRSCEGAFWARFGIVSTWHGALIIQVL